MKGSLKEVIIIGVGIALGSILTSLINKSKA